MPKFIALMLAGVILLASLGACSWAGRTTGKVVNNVEKGADQFEDSYQKERSKTE